MTAASPKHKAKGRQPATHAHDSSPYEWQNSTTA